MKFSVEVISLAIASLMLALPAAAAPAAAPVVTDAWVKPTIPGGTVSAAYMSIKSATPVKLVKAETAAAEIVEIHNMNMKDGVMVMKAIAAVDVPADKVVELKPGGLHVMLMKVRKSINVGDKVPLTLTFEGTDKKSLVVRVDAKVQEKAAQTPAR